MLLVPRDLHSLARKFHQGIWFWPGAQDYGPTTDLSSFGVPVPMNKRPTIPVLWITANGTLPPPSKETPWEPIIKNGPWENSHTHTL